MDKHGSNKVREVSPAYGPKAGDLTYEDYLRMPVGQRYELVEGEIRMVPTPSARHQEVSVNIERALYRAMDSRLGRVYHAPLEVLLDEHVLMQPDIMFITESRLRIVKGPYVGGAPDLVVEILSPTTEDLDRIAKRRIYSRYGVQEYWIVDVDRKTVEVNRSQDGQLRVVETLGTMDVLKSPLLSGINIRVEDLFRT
jgi:Uma2 family endonuclease